MNWLVVFARTNALVSGFRLGDHAWFFPGGGGGGTIFFWGGGVVKAGVQKTPSFGQYGPTVSESCKFDQICKDFLFFFHIISSYIITRVFAVNLSTSARTGWFMLPLSSAHTPFVGPALIDGFRPSSSFALCVERRRRGIHRFHRAFVVTFRRKSS